jgi:urease accessory protein
MARAWRTITAAAGLMLTAAPALAHHPMGGRLPSTLTEGMLSGLGHPIIGLDHLAAVVAIGCLAALHRVGAGLVIGYVLAMVLGAAIHVQGATLPAAEALVALSVIALGAVLIWARALPALAALALFAIAGLFHGYALGESIVGAERTALVAYFAGLAVVQSVIGLGVMLAVRLLVQQAPRRMEAAPYLGGAVIAVGLFALATQFAA